MPPWVLGGALLIGAAATVLASVPAALRGSRLSIAEALHRLV